MKTQLAILVSLLVAGFAVPAICSGDEPNEQPSPIAVNRVFSVRVHGPPTRKYEPLMISDAFGKDRMNELFSFFPELASLDSAEGIQPVNAAKKNRVVLRSLRNLKDGSYDIDVELYVLEGDSIWTYDGKFFSLRAGWSDYLKKEYARQEKDRESSGMPKLLQVNKDGADASGFRVEIGNWLKDEYRQFNVYLKPELAAKFDHTYLAYFRESEFLLGGTAHSRKMDDGQLRIAFNINPKIAANVRFTVQIARKPRPIIYRFDLKSFLTNETETARVSTDDESMEVCAFEVQRQDSEGHTTTPNEAKGAESTSHSEEGAKLDDRLLHELDVTPTAIGFSGDSKLLAVADSKSVTIWNTTDGRRIRELKDYTIPVTGVALSPNGKLLATVGCTMTRPGDFELKLWDLEGGKAIESIYEKDHRGKMDAANPQPFVTFSADGTLIAFPAKDRHVSVRKVSDWSELQSLKISNVPSVGAFSPDRKLLAIGTHNHGWALLYDLESGKRIRIVSSITASPTRQVSFSDDGQLIYAVYGGYVFRQDTLATDSGYSDEDTIWAMHKSKLPRMKRPFAWSYSVTNHLLALQHADSLELFDTNTQTTRATIADSKGLAVFSPDGKLLVTSNESGKTVLRAIPSK